MWISGPVTAECRGTRLSTGINNHFIPCFFRYNFYGEGMNTEPKQAVKPLLRVLRGEIVFPPPIWLMRQAGRYLPEYRAVRTKAKDFIALCTDPKSAAEVTLQPVRRFGLDAAILFSDILMLPWALGYPVRFAEGEGPLLPPLQPADIDRLDWKRLDSAIAPILETIQRVRSSLDSQTTLIGFAGGPFTVACYMVDGKAAEGFPLTRAFAWRRPEEFSRLIEQLTEATIAYLRAQVKAGAEAVMLFESSAGLLSPRLFSDYVIAPTARIASAFRSEFHGIPMIGFPRLAGLNLVRYGNTAGIQALGLDTTADPGVITPLLSSEMPLQGNLDPMALLVGQRALAQEVAAVLAAFSGRPHVFNLGHGVLPETPPQHVAELVRLVRSATVPS